MAELADALDLGSSGVIHRGSSPLPRTNYSKEQKMSTKHPITTKIEDVSPIKKKISVEIPVERIKETIEKMYEKVGKEAKLKGFRKGKVPRTVLEQYYKDDVHKEAMEQLVRDSYPEAIDKENAMPISAPYVDPGPFDVEKPFTYVATFEIRPVVDIKGYDGLKLEKPEVSVEKKEVEDHLKMVQQQMTQLEPVADDAKAEAGMVLVVDFKGSADGEKFKGSEAKDFYVDLGAGNMLKPFEEALTGMTKNEEKEFEFDYPTDYFNKDLAGKKGKFHVKVKDLKRKLVPELNDEIAKDLGNFKTLAEVKADIEKRILELKEQNVKRILSTQVMDQLVEKHAFEIPEAMINSELQAMFEGFVRHLQQQGKKFEDTGMSVEKFIENYKKDAETRVRGFLVIDAIGDLEKITVTDEEVEARLKMIAEQSGQPLPRVRQQYESQNLLGALKIQLRHEKTVDLIIDKAKIKVKKEKS